MFVPARTAAAALLSLLLVDGVQGQTNTTQTTLSGFPPCDALIAANLSHAVHLASSPSYPDLVKGSWSISTQFTPWCFVQPSTPAEVAQTIAALQAAGGGAGDWHVAIRSGGHGGDNQNNIEDGVTIDLTYLNTTTYDASTKIASLGTGARWGAVYSALDEQGVSVVGGRESVVGVGGLTLGGGISWYNARMGMGCDNVVNYEVVLADGRIVNANASSNPDLWLALRGGSSNFGIVTRFDVETFPAQNLSITRRAISVEQSEKVVAAVHDFTNLPRSFKDDAMIMVMTYAPDAGVVMTVTEINLANNANSTGFNAFKPIPTIAPTTTNSVSLAESANSVQLAGGQLNAGGGLLTIANDPRVMNYAIEQHQSLLPVVKALVGAENFTTILDFQPFPSYFAQISKEKGGNMLGIDPNSRNKVVFALGVTLTSPAAEAKYPEVLQLVTSAAQRVKAYSEAIGAGEDFTYLAYAKANQDPLGSYGAANVEHIRQTARKYDPECWFQKAVPGGFKIDRVTKFNKEEL